MPPLTLEQIVERLRHMEPGKLRRIARRLDGDRATPAGTHRPARLVSFVEPRAPVAPDQLLDYISDELPAFMVPSAIRVVESLPRLPNGKIDVRALEDLAQGSDGEQEEGGFVEPRNEAERLLCDIWSEALGFSEIGVFDDFYAIGGDSILSIQVVSRAREAGFSFTPAQFLESRQIAELASFFGERVDPEMPAQQSGPVPLSPIQHWFFSDHPTDPHHWGQTLDLEVAADVDTARIEGALDEIVRRHDGLRQRFMRQSEKWTAEIVDDVAAVPVRSMSAPASDPEALEALLDEKVAIEHAAMNLAEPPLLRAILVETASERNRLLLLAHHLVIDAVSWNVLLGDLDAMLAEPRRPPARSVIPYRAWAEGIHARAEAATRQRRFWIDQHGDRALAPGLPSDPPPRERDMRRWATVIDRSTTGRLLAASDGSVGAEPLDILLAAALRAWTVLTGRRALRVGLELHGRNVPAELDLSRTMGWLTTYFPLLLRAPNPEEPATLLRGVRSVRRAVPDAGAGYGLLRYVLRDPGLADDDTPEILVNYMGRVDRTRPSGVACSVVGFRPVGARSPEAEHPHVVEVNAAVEGDLLTIEIFTSARDFDPTWGERFAEHVRRAIPSLLDAGARSEPSAYAPSDFPDVELSDEELDALLGDVGEEG